MKIKHTPKAEAYHAINKESIKFQEDNDCSVRALTALIGNYERAHKIMEQVGRKPKKGAMTHIILKGFEDAGFKLHAVPARTFIDQYPTAHRNALKHVTTHHPERFNAVWKDGNSYIMFTASHVLALIDGLNVDHTKGKMWRAKLIYRVEKLPRALMVLPEPIGYVAPVAIPVATRKPRASKRNMLKIEELATSLNNF